MQQQQDAEPPKLRVGFRDVATLSGTFFVSPTAPMQYSSSVFLFTEHLLRERKNAVALLGAPPNHPAKARESRTAREAFSVILLRVLLRYRYLAHRFSDGFCFGCRLLLLLGGRLSFSVSSAVDFISSLIVWHVADACRGEPGFPSRGRSTKRPWPDCRCGVCGLPCPCRRPGRWESGRVGEG